MLTIHRMPCRSAGLVTGIWGCLFATAAVIGGEIPTRIPAELLRKNGTVLQVPMLIGVSRGNVSAHSETSLVPLNFRSGEIQAIRFQRSEKEPEINGSCRLKYLYDPKSKGFEKHRILASISAWGVSQGSSVREWDELILRRNEDDELILVPTRKRKTVYADTARLTATFRNKQPTAVAIRYELSLLSNCYGGDLHSHQITLGGNEERHVALDVATRGCAVEGAVISDVYNFLVNEGMPQDAAPKEELGFHLLED